MHNLAEFRDRNGITKTSSYSLRESPWHKLGTVVNRPLADSDLLHAAGLDWLPRKLPMFTSEFDPVPDQCAIKRSDDGRVLGVVGKDYESIHHAEMMELLRGVNGLRNLNVETAGALGNGEVVWIMMRLDELDFAINGDESNCYLLVTTGHIGNKPVMITPTSVRVVCQNTLNLAMRNRGKSGLSKGIRVRHTKGMKTALADAQRSLGEALRSQSLTVEGMRYLASRPLTTLMKRQVFDAVFQISKEHDESQRAKTIKENREQRINELLESPTNQIAGTRNSGFSLLNAITEYIDHERPSRGVDSNRQRLASANFGSGSKLKESAWQAVLTAV